MDAFRGPTTVAPRTIANDHDGRGPILFRRLFVGVELQTPVDFVDFTLIPPGSAIGYHRHLGNEEFYLVSRGQPLVTVEDECRRLGPGDVVVVRSGQSHGLVNDGDTEVAIFVVQAHLQEPARP
jgi:mannose-6-phosphate isomerase-like protein (cupin superfamily)